MYKVALIEDDEMMKRMITSRMERKFENGESLKVISLKFEQLTVEELIDSIYTEKFDALVLDYKLNGSTPPVFYDGTDIALAMEEEVHFFPVFILTSFELDAEKDEYADVNKIYKKDLYIADETGAYVNFVNNKINDQISHYKNRLKAYEEELILLRSKVDKTNEEKNRELMLDHILEKSVLGRNAMPLNQKIKDERLDKIIKLAERLLSEKESEN